MVSRFDDTQLYKLLLANDFQAIDNFLNKYGIDSVDRDGRTFLMSAVSEKKIDIVAHLLSNGANVNAHDAQGLSALHLASLDNNLEIAELLVNNKAVIDQVDNEGNTPLWRAVMSFDEDAETVKYLISKGADINKENNHGVSPADLM